jgi:hypothetical protein
MKRYTKMIVGPENAPIFDELNFVLEIGDDASGEYLKVRSLLDCNNNGEIRIDADEWDELKEAIDTMIASLKTYE